MINSTTRILAIVTGIVFAFSLTSNTRVYAEHAALLVVDGTFTDEKTGFDVNLEFFAIENLGTDVGFTNALITAFSEIGPAIRTCSTHGSVVGEDVFPLTNIECGAAGRMRVSINECKATVETHGYVHSDYPFTAYSGSATIEIKLSRKGITQPIFCNLSGNQVSPSYSNRPGSDTAGQSTTPREFQPRRPRSISGPRLHSGRSRPLGCGAGSPC